MASRDLQVVAILDITHVHQSSGGVKWGGVRQGGGLPSFITVTPPWPTLTLLTMYTHCLVLQQKKIFKGFILKLIKIIILFEDVISLINKTVKIIWQYIVMLRPHLANSITCMTIMHGYNKMVLLRTTAL